MSTLSTAALDRKARLAALKSKSLKRPAEDSLPSTSPAPTPKSPKLSHASSSAATAHTSPAQDASSTDPSSTPSTTDKYLSGRNYDPLTKAPRLGFETNPAGSSDTLEARADVILAVTQQQQLKAKQEEKPLDLFDLQPRKPNWDLKRDLERKLVVVNVRTENAIARLVRARVLAEQEKARERARSGNGGVGGVSGDMGDLGDGGEGDGEVVGMEGNALAQAVHQRELEEQEEERRERAEEQEND